MQEEWQELLKAGYDVHTTFNGRFQEYVLIAVLKGKAFWFFEKTEESVIHDAWRNLIGEKK